MSDNADNTPTPTETPEQSLDDFEKDLFGSDTAPAKVEETEEEVESAEEVDTASEEETPPEDDSSTEDAESEEEVAEEEEDAPKPQKKTRAQERIEELNSKYREEERRRIELEARLKALEEGSDKEGNETPKPTAKEGDPQAPTPDDVDSEGNKKYPLGEFDPKFTRDTVTFMMAQERAKMEEEQQEMRKRAEQDQARQELQQNWEQQLEPARQRYADFQEKGQELVDSFNDLDAGYSEYLTNTLMRLDNGADVFYHLASNPELAHEIVNKGPALASVELGKISAAVGSVSETNPTPTKVTKAPPPPPRAKGTGTPKKRDILNNLDDFEASFFKG